MEEVQNRETGQGYRSIMFRSVQVPVRVEDISSSPPSLHQLSSPLQVPSFCFNSNKGPAPKPLLDIDVVRSFIRSKLGPLKPETHHSSTTKVHTGMFGIGTMGFSGSDGGYVDLSSPQANEHQGEISSLPFAQEQNGFVQDQTENGNDQGRAHHGYQHSDARSYNLYSKPVQHANKQPVYDENDNDPSMANHGSYKQQSAPLLDLDDVRYNLISFLHDTGLRCRTSTSLANKLPWHVPRAPFLARGLEWPPDSFVSEEAKKAYYKRARKRKPFMLGSPPLWTVTAFNLAFFQILMYNPVARFFDYLMKLP